MYDDFNFIKLLGTNRKMQHDGGVAMEHNRIKTELSIKPLMKYLKQRKAQQDPAIGDDVDLLSKFENDLMPKHNSELREAIVKILDYVLKKDDDDCWALTSPLSSEFYYISESLSGVLSSGQKEQQHDLNKLASSLPYSELCYKYILEEFYHYTLPLIPELVREVKTDKPQLSTFFQITQDNRFVEIGSDIPIPDIDTNSIDLTDPDCPEILELKKLLPLSRVQAEGFSILNFKEVN